MSLEGAIATHRFGLGARAGEIEAASKSPKDWLMRQLDGRADEPQPVDGDGPYKSTGDIVGDFMAYRIAAKSARSTGQDENASDLQMRKQDFDALRKDRSHDHEREMAGRFALAFTTDKPFAERLALFWSNHFSVSVTSAQARPFVGAFEREAIRPNISGKFEDLLVAVTQHPAMLLYLGNFQSIGPNSKAGKINGHGINENLGREIMELHTLGVNGGYAQADVIAMAKILTGWSLDRRGGTGFKFYEARHEPGDILFRGKTYPDRGEQQGLSALSDLAHDPATARHIAQKFAVHFISDNPPAESVARLEKSFRDTGGDLKALAQTLVDDPAAWQPATVKMRAPVDYINASMRALGWPWTEDVHQRDQQMHSVIAASRMMGEFPFMAPSPKGWPDNSDAWSGGNAMLNRIEWAKETGNHLPPGINPASIADQSLGPLLQPATRTAMKNAATPGEAVALLIASPEFQRR
jgi:uncharacterized protein (DUF1800 family)